MNSQTNLLKKILFYSFVVLPLLLIALPKNANAGPELVPVEGASFSVNHSMADNLKHFTGKKVYLTISSGKVLGGYVKEVGGNFVHIEKMDGKDYFDGLVKIDSIVAMDARFRKVKR